MSYNRVQQGCSQHPSCTGQERLDKAIQSPVFSSCGYPLIVNGLKQPVSYVVQKDPRLCTRKPLSATPPSTEVIQLHFGTAFKQTNKQYEDMRPSRYQLSMGSRPVTSTHLWDEHGWKSYRSNIAETVNVVTKIVTPELPNRNPWYVAFAGNIICFGNPFLNTLYKGMRGHRGAGGSFRPAETNIWQSFVGIIPKKTQCIIPMR